MRRRPRSRIAVSGLLLTLALAACLPQRHEASPRHSPSPAPARPTPTASPSDCPPAYAEPDPHRPVIRLDFALSADLRHVTGKESVRFTPDLPVTELVFRLWPNGVTAPAGTKLTVSRAVVAGAGALTTQSLGGAPGTQGTLLSIPLRRTAPAGQPIVADLTFALDLPKPTFERWGSSGSTAWWASGHPLLAWERGGGGWQRQPAVRFPSEAAVSEAADTEINVTTPGGVTALMTGSDAPAAAAAGGRLLWHARLATARDLSVSVGRFTVRTGEVAGVHVRVGIASDAVADADALLSQTKRSISALVGLYGPFPYPGVNMSVLPGAFGGGIEYPGAVQLGPQGWIVIVPHELAHQYFYGMVGDNQARDPWLDEAFATYSEARVNHTEAVDLPALHLPGSVGAPMASWGNNDKGYYATIYGKGAAALLTARQQAGSAAFDAALRCYVHANAWTVATPDDLVRALAGLPRAIAVLRAAGALP